MIRTLAVGLLAACATGQAPQKPKEAPKPTPYYRIVLEKLDDTTAEDVKKALGKLPAVASIKVDVAGKTVRILTKPDKSDEGERLLLSESGVRKLLSELAGPIQKFVKPDWAKCTVWIVVASGGG